MTTPIPKYIADSIAKLGKPNWVSLDMTQEDYCNNSVVKGTLLPSQVHNPTGAWLNGKIPKMDDSGNIIPNQFFMVAKKTPAASSLPKKPTALSQPQPAVPVTPAPQAPVSTPQHSEEWIYFKGEPLPDEAVVPTGMSEQYMNGNIYYSKKSHWCWTKWANHETQQQMYLQGIKLVPGMYDNPLDPVVTKPVKASIPLLSSYALRTASRPSKLPA